MKRIGVFGTLLGLGLLGVAVSAAWAKGPPQKIVIEGPGLNGPIEITDKPQLEALGMASLEDFVGLTPDPGLLTRVYLLTRFYQDGSRFIPFDQVLFAPGPAGEPGYVLYLGIVNGWSEYDGKWFRATRAGTRAMEAVLGAAAMAVEPVDAPVVSAAMVDPAAADMSEPADRPIRPTSALLGAALAAAGFSAGWLLRPLRRRPAPS